jgi:Arc/MetJ family transcription regulator
MRTTITIDDDLLADAKEFTGIVETSALVKKALALLVQDEVSRRLSLLGGTDPDFRAAPRWRPDEP